MSDSALAEDGNSGKVIVIKLQTAKAERSDRNSIAESVVISNKSSITYQLNTGQRLGQQCISYYLRIK